MNQIPSFSEILFYGILNFTNNTVEFASDIIEGPLNQSSNKDISTFTCDELFSLFLTYVPENEKLILQGIFSRKNALSLYGQGKQNIQHELNIWSLRIKTKARFFLDVQRDRYSGAIKGYFYIFEARSIKTSTVKTKGRLVRGDLSCVKLNDKSLPKGRFDEFVEMTVKREESDYVISYVGITNFEELKSFLEYEDNIKLISVIQEIINNNLRDGEAYCNVYFSSFFMLLKYENREHLEQRLWDIGSLINKINRTVVGAKFSANLSYGVAFVPNDAPLDVPSLMKQAILAQGATAPKNLCGFSCVYFNEKLQEKILREKYIEENIQEALQAGEFEIHLQPKFDIATEQVIGVEALARWNDSGRIIFPQEFIPLLESNNKIEDLDLFVFEKACALLQKWINEGKSPVPISVNTSKTHLHKKGFFDGYKAILKKYAIPPSLIEMEITESVLSENTEILKAAVSEIHKAGMRCSLDDFGSGYSSLNLIKEIDVDSIKIDRTFFLYNPTHEHRAIKVLESIINVAKALSMEIVAEGVETMDQIKSLKKMGCNIVQCYLTSRPLKVEDFEEKYIDNALLEVGM